MLKRLFDGEQIVELGAIVQTFDLLGWCLELELFERWKCGPEVAGVGCQRGAFHSADVWWSTAMGLAGVTGPP